VNSLRKDNTIHEAHLAAFIGQRTDVQAACDELLAGPLAARDALLHFYAREVLFSLRARAAWVEPDLAPLGG
jgi:hypothetical protein